MNYSNYLANSSESERRADLEEAVKPQLPEIGTVSSDRGNEGKHLKHVDGWCIEEDLEDVLPLAESIPHPESQNTDNGERNTTSNGWDFDEFDISSTLDPGSKAVPLTNPEVEQDMDGRGSPCLIDFELQETFQKTETQDKRKVLESSPLSFISLPLSMDETAVGSSHEPPVMSAHTTSATIEESLAHEDSAAGNSSSEPLLSSPSPSSSPSSPKSESSCSVAEPVALTRLSGEEEALWRRAVSMPQVETTVDPWEPLPVIDIPRSKPKPKKQSLVVMPSLFESSTLPYTSPKSSLLHFKSESSEDKRTSGDEEVQLDDANYFELPGLGLASSLVNQEEAVSSSVAAMSGSSKASPMRILQKLWDSKGETQGDDQGQGEKQKEEEEDSGSSVQLSQPFPETERASSRVCYACGKVNASFHSEVRYCQFCGTCLLGEEKKPMVVSSESDEESIEDDIDETDKLTDQYNQLQFKFDPRDLTKDHPSRHYHHHLQPSKAHHYRGLLKRAATMMPHRGKKQVPRMSKPSLPPPPPPLEAECSPQNKKRREMDGGEDLSHDLALMSLEDSEEEMDPSLVKKLLESQRLYSAFQFAFLPVRGQGIVPISIFTIPKAMVEYGRSRLSKRWTMVTVYKPGEITLSFGGYAQLFIGPEHQESVFETWLTWLGLHHLLDTTIQDTNHETELSVWKALLLNEQLDQLAREEKLQSYSNILECLICTESIIERKMLWTWLRGAFKALFEPVPLEEDLKDEDQDSPQEHLLHFNEYLRKLAMDSFEDQEGETTKWSLTQLDRLLLAEDLKRVRDYCRANGKDLFELIFSLKKAEMDNPDWLLRIQALLNESFGDQENDISVELLFRIYLIFGECALALNLLHTTLLARPQWLDRRWPAILWHSINALSPQSYPEFYRRLGEDVFSPSGYAYLEQLCFLLGGSKVNKLCLLEHAMPTTGRLRYDWMIAYISTRLTQVYLSESQYETNDGDLDMKSMVEGTLRVNIWYWEFASYQTEAWDLLKAAIKGYKAWNDQDMEQKRKESIWFYGWIKRLEAASDCCFDQVVEESLKQETIFARGMEEPSRAEIKFPIPALPTASTLLQGNQGLLSLTPLNVKEGSGGFGFQETFNFNYQHGSEFKYQDDSGVHYQQSTMDDHMIPYKSHTETSPTKEYVEAKGEEPLGHETGTVDNIRAEDERIESEYPEEGEEEVEEVEDLGFSTAPKSKPKKASLEHLPEASASSTKPVSSKASTTSSDQLSNRSSLLRSFMGIFRRSAFTASPGDGGIRAIKADLGQENQMEYDPIFGVWKMKGSKVDSNEDKSKAVKPPPLVHTSSQTGLAPSSSVNPLALESEPTLTWEESTTASSLFLASGGSMNGSESLTNPTPQSVLTSASSGSSYGSSFYAGADYMSTAGGNKKRQKYVDPFFVSPTPKAAAVAPISTSHTQHLLSSQQVGLVAYSDKFPSREEPKVAATQSHGTPYRTLQQQSVEVSERVRAADPSSEHAFIGV